MYFSKVFVGVQNIPKRNWATDLFFFSMVSMVSTPKNMFFVWPNGFSLEKGALKVQPNKGRAEKTYFLLFYRKIAKKGPKRSKKMSKNGRSDFGNNSILPQHL